MKNLSLLLFISLFGFTSSKSILKTNSPDPKLDAKINSAITNWSIPGLAVVVIKGGDIILIKGYGTRTLNSSEPITEETYLQIASNSKMFTAYMFGMLVDDGKLMWDDPVKKYIPEFKLADPILTNIISIDDLLSHRSGLTEMPLGGFQNPDYEIEDLLKDLEETPLSTRFRTQNNYSQVGMALLGEIVRRATGKSWEDYLVKRIFTPLGMEASFSSNAQFKTNIGNPENVKDIMTPALRSNGKVSSVSWQGIGTESLYAPAGGIISNMGDMATWIQFRVRDGMANDKSLISSASLKEIRKPRIPTDMSSVGIPLSYIHPCAQLGDVGFGHYSFEHRGRKVITHNGGWMSSVISIMPGEDLGVGVFSNAWYDEPMPWTSLAFVNAITLDILDHYMGYEDIDWSALMATILKARKSGDSIEGFCDL